MRERAERFAGYRRARLRVPGLDVELDAAADGTGRFPFDGPVHVLTAHNPGSVVLDAVENDRRQQALRAELPAGLRQWEAEAGAADGSHTERSVLVEGLTDDEAVRLAARYGQDAIFRWTADAWSILPCDGGAPTRSGWRTHPLRRGT